MSLNLAAITIDCADALVVSRFWSDALERPIDTNEPTASPFFARLVAGEGDHPAPVMMFIQVPETKTVKNRVHLDLSADDREAEVERLINLGASRVHDKDEWGVRWTTLADPEGNEFCVAEHG